MAGPENKENLDSVLAKPMNLPRADSDAIMSTQGAVQLPARPAESLTIDQGLSSGDRSKTPANSREQQENNHLIKEALLRIRTEDIEVWVVRTDQYRKELAGPPTFENFPDRELLTLVESIVKLSGDANLNAQMADGTLGQEAMARHLLSCISQQRSFDCSIQDIAMLDSLEFQLMRILQHLNPNIRIQQQQTQEEMGKDDDAAASGPEKVEDDDRDSGRDDIEDFDLDSDYAPSPRSKKGKAKGKARDRRSRFRKWLARMMRVFRSNSLVIPAAARRQSSVKTQEKVQKYVITVRVFGRVIGARTKLGIKGVKVVSSSFGEVETSADGSFAFENVTLGVTYLLAPLKSGCSFTPLSVNDIALDSREHTFFMVEEA